MVERMFRSRTLKVVVSTSTLAVGIHMPCRTVVFPEYSQLLDAMSFHQMAGRAGRRGFDEIGNVVFGDFDYPRIKQLVLHNTLRLSSLQRINTTAILQLLQLSKWDPSRAKFALLGTLHDFIGGKKSAEQIKNSYALSLRLFTKIGIASASLDCTAQAAAAMRLSNYAPASFHLLKIFLCEALDRTQFALTDEEIIYILALSFNYKEARPLNSKELKGALPTLSPKIVALIDHLNSSILWEACRVIDQRAKPTHLFSSPLLLKSFDVVKKDTFALARRLYAPHFCKVPNTDAAVDVAQLSGPTKSSPSVFESTLDAFEASCNQTFGFDVESLPLLILEPHVDAFVVYSFFSAPVPALGDEETMEESIQSLLEGIHDRVKLFGSESARLVSNFVKFVHKVSMALHALPTSYPESSNSIVRLTKRIDLISQRVKSRAEYLNRKGVDPVEMNSAPSTPAMARQKENGASQGFRRPNLSGTSSQKRAGKQSNAPAGSAKKSKPQNLDTKTSATSDWRTQNPFQLLLDEEEEPSVAPSPPPDAAKKASPTSSGAKTPAPQPAVRIAPKQAPPTKSPAPTSPKQAQSPKIKRKEKAMQKKKASAPKKPPNSTVKTSTKPKKK